MSTTKKKPTHPWRAWNPEAFKRRAAPCSYKETLKGITTKNRAI